MLTNLVRGLTALGNGQSIVYLVVGSLMGVFIGVIPGLSGAVILTIVLAFIYHISLTGVLCLFLATQAGSYFSASITSILLNTPAHPEAFAVTFDGFPMAQRGEAGRALGISATATCIGGLIGCAALVGFIPIMNSIPGLFHPPEFVALITIALLLVGTLGTDNVSKALISLGIAIILSSIGSDPITGVYRYTFGAIGLLGGISLVALFLGLFAIPQMVLVYGTATTIATQDMMGKEITDATPIALQKGFHSQVIQGVRETLKNWVALVRSALIGVVTGLIPGIGGFAANFMSYGVAQQFSKRREAFGTGIPEGIIAPEGSSLAKEAGGMVPTLGLGVPGGIGSALFIAALAIKGVKVGYGFTTQYPTLAYEAVWVIALGGVVGTVAGLIAAPWLARVTRVPGPALLPFIMAISVIGTYAADVSFFSVMEIAVFAFVGFVLRRLRYSLAAFGIGLVLGPTLESNIYLTHTVFPGLTFLARQPFADVLFAIAIGLLVIKGVQVHRDNQKVLEAQKLGGPRSPAAIQFSLDQLRHPYPLLGALVTIVMFAFGAVFTVYGAMHYAFATAIFPVIGGALCGGVALWRVPTDVGAYIRYRANRRVGILNPGQDVENVEEETAGRLLEAPSGFAESVLAGTELTDALLVQTLPAEKVETQPERGVPEFKERYGAVRMKGWGRNGQYTREAIALLWFLGLVGLCYAVDFNIGIPVFCVAYGLLGTRRIFPNLRKRLMFAGVSALAMWGATIEIENVLHVVFTPVIRL